MSCVFCDIAARRATAHIVYEDEETLAFLDRFPIHEGHTLVIPKKHATDAFDVEPEQAARTMRTAVRVARAVKAVTQCDGVNLFQSNGAAAGQSVFHFHIHVLPRWIGDRTITLHREYTPLEGSFERVAAKIREIAQSVG
jgi:histidine triad (HIT) family protein